MTDEIIKNTGTIAVSSDELNSVNNYCHARNASVLTVMFIGIAGFNELIEQMGEEYANSIKTEHDRVISKIVENDYAGFVVKYLWDGLIAVFSEPVTAVKKALEIQKTIGSKNVFKDIKIRLGLHLGKVSVDKHIQPDVFEKYVFIAAGIRDLASGRQIYITDSVFVRTKECLKEKENISWQSHGKYYLNGIKQPQEIFEVYGKPLLKPHPPKHARKKRWAPRFVPGISLVLLGIFSVLMFLHLKTVNLWFVKFYPAELIMDHKEKIIFDGKVDDVHRKIILKIKSGRHVFHFDASSSTRYYTEIDVKSGDNYIKPKFEYLSLPSMNKRFTINILNFDSFNDVQEEEYFVYDKKRNKRFNKNVKFYIVINAERKKDVTLFFVEYIVILDHKEIASNFLTLETSVNNKENERIDRVTIFEDDFHLYYYEYYLTKGTIDFTIGSMFIEYKE